MPEVDREIAKDYMADAIANDIDVDWTYRDGAESVLAMIEAEGWRITDCDPRETRARGVRAGILYSFIATLCGCGVGALAYSLLS